MSGPANEHVCARCQHVKSAHLHGGHGGIIGTCKLQSCTCTGFEYVVERRATQDDLREQAQTAGGGVVERRGPQETWTGKTPFMAKVAKDIDVWQEGKRPTASSFLPAAKDTNPKDAVGTCKVPCSTVSAPVIAEVGLAMLEGARKYGRHNFRVSGVRASVYYDAVKTRHLDPWWEGEDIDPDSGLSHITKAIAGLVVLRDSMIQGNWLDDRPPPSPAGWLAELNKKAAEIVAKYPNAKEAFLATDTTADIARKLGK